jgi:DNA-binding transcriptional LysR family regulator
MTDLDPKLLQIFLAIHESGSVSRAAERLGLTQPTLSFSLAKLRAHYGDALFVRAGQRMVPTPFAQDLHGLAAQAVSAWRAAAQRRLAFDPAVAERGFVMAMTDISQIVLLPGLLHALPAIAPGLRIAVRHINEATASDLEAGTVDLAVGFMPQLFSGFYKQKLFDERYVCLCAADHPRVGSRLERKRYCAERHVAVLPSGTGHQHFEKSLRTHGIARDIVLELPSFLGLGATVAGTELLAAAPSRYAAQARKRDGTRTLPLPFKVPPYAVNQYWHERNHGDAGHRWLRATMMRLFKAA